MKSLVEFFLFIVWFLLTVSFVRAHDVYKIVCLFSLKLSQSILDTVVEDVRLRCWSCWILAAPSESLSMLPVHFFENLTSRRGSVPYPMRSVGGVLISLRPWARRWIMHWSLTHGQCDAWWHWRVWTTCPSFLHKSAAGPAVEPATSAPLQLHLQAAWTLVNLFSPIYLLFSPPGFNCCCAAAWWAR